MIRNGDMRSLYRLSNSASPLKKNRADRRHNGIHISGRCTNPNSDPDQKVKDCLRVLPPSPRAQKKYNDFNFGQQLSVEIKRSK